MAGLPPDGTWLVQQIGGQVVIIHRYTEEELLRFDPSDADSAAKAQLGIYTLTQLTEEQRAFAHFWAGYFYAHAAYPGLAGAEFTVVLKPEEAGK